jgi:predicted SAM-dependent methyltransferase
MITINSLERLDTVVGLRQDLRKIKRILRRPSTAIALKSYLNSHPISKLELGSGANRKPGWIMTDIGGPLIGQPWYIDVTKPFPIEDSTFDYVLSEHVIEHISYQHGMSMLRECHRILKPGGTVRIGTPDLEMLMALYGPMHNPRQERYIHEVTDKFLPGIDEYKPSFVINNMFRNWCHQFIYDRDLLQSAMEKVGFTDIKRFLPGESDNEHLKGIESRAKKMDDKERNEFQTLILEAICQK